MRYGFPRKNIFLKKNSENILRREKNKNKKLEHFAMSYPHKYASATHYAQRGALINKTLFAI